MLHDSYGACCDMSMFLLTQLRYYLLHQRRYLWHLHSLREDVHHLLRVTYFNLMTPLSVYTDVILSSKIKHVWYALWIRLWTFVWMVPWLPQQQRILSSPTVLREIAWRTLCTSWVHSASRFDFTAIGYPLISNRYPVILLRPSLSRPQSGSEYPTSVCWCHRLYVSWNVHQCTVE